MRLIPALFIASALCAVLPVRADLASSASLSEAVSAAVGSLSESLVASSASISGDDKDKKTAAGDYRVQEVTQTTDPDTLRLTLDAVDGTGAQGRYFLKVPRQTAWAHKVDVGTVVTVQARPYGLALATGADRHAFYLLMDDAWYRELATRPVVL